VTTLTAADLADAHPELPDGWRRSMVQVKRRGGPWACGTCGAASLLCYRCSKCGRDLATDTNTNAGRGPTGG